MKGKVALVTGGASGIGRAVAIALAAQGAHVFIFDLLDGASVVTEIGDRGGEATAIAGDVSRETEVMALMARIGRQAGRLDIAVNCAGIQIIKPLLETTGENLDNVYSVNLRGTFLIGREAARMMLQRNPPGGRIINISSELAYVGRANYSAYCSTKGAILALTRSWARELAPHILVNAVAPGPTDTAMVSLKALTQAELQDEYNSVPLGRIANPSEVAATVVFLAGPDAAFYTGQCLSPNGGAAMSQAYRLDCLG